MNINELIEITESLMSEYNIEMRDTWIKFKEIDVSQIYPGYTNELNIKEYKNNDAEFKTDKYNCNIEGYNCCLYKNPTINIPMDCRCVHTIIHEIVHFLQHATAKDHIEYLTINQTSSIKERMNYVLQKIEKEAFFIQLKYIIKYEKNILNNPLFEKNSAVKKYIKFAQSINFNDEIANDVLFNLYINKVFNYNI